VLVIGVLATVLLVGPAHGGATGFSAHVTNPWFPLTPGTTYVYQGVKDGKPSRELLTVTHRTKTIAGGPCAVVEDSLYLSGKLFDRIKIKPFFVRGVKNLVCQILKREFFVV